MSNYNRVPSVLIGDGANAAAAALTTLPTVKAGDLFLVNEAGTIVPTNAAAQALKKIERVSILQGTGDGDFLLSAPIQGNLVSKYTGTKYQAASEQVTYIGHNPVSGSGNISVSDDTEYTLRILYKDDIRAHGQRQTTDKYNFTTGTGATLLQLAQGIAKAADTSDQILSQGEGLVTVERVSNGTFTAKANPAIVTKGSKIVTSTAHALTVGTVVRIGGTTALSPIYQVAGVIDANKFLLDTNYVGASGTVLAINFGVMTVITNVGFKVTGTDIAYNKYDKYSKVAFEASLSSGGLNNSTAGTSAPVVTTARVSYGEGVWRQVRDAEQWAQTYLGGMNRTAFPVIDLPEYTIKGTNYNTLVIEHDLLPGADFQDVTRAPLSTVVYIPLLTASPVAGEQANETAEDFIHILNGYFSTVLSFPVVDFS